MTVRPVAPGEPPTAQVPQDLLRAISDPGSVLPRGVLGEGWDGTLDLESLPSWQGRAVLAAGYHYCGCDDASPAVVAGGGGTEDGDQ